MKTKPVIITLSVVIMAIAVFFVVKGRHVPEPGKEGVIKFLEAFDRQVEAGNTDSIAGFFEVKQKAAVLQHLINVLANKSGVKEGQSPLFNLALDMEKSQVRVVNEQLTRATIPVRFVNDSIPTMHTVIKFGVHRTKENTYKIVQVDANKMMADYLTYNTKVKGKTLTDSDIYSAITLKAFDTAKQLKTKYDTVVWFAHDGEKNYYYVVNGKWNQERDIEQYYKDSVKEPYKMGLIGPGLKEVIPVEYDLIHTIGATFPGLVEVEKGDKKGFYDLQGKNVLPVNYDQIFPVSDEDNMAVLRNGDDYFYLKKDMSVSEKADIKVGDFFPKVRKVRDSYNFYKNALEIVTEYNSRLDNSAIYIPPSYLADLNLISKAEDFKNPLRKADDGETNTDYNVDFSDDTKDESNWLEASFYSIRNYFLGGREEFYDKRNIVIVDKKRNRVFAKDIGTDYTQDEDSGSLTGTCDINAIKVINDSLFEVKIGALFYANLYDSTKTITGGPYYHYMVVRNNKLVELPGGRIFGFTKYVKMDDSYLNGCYILDETVSGSDKPKQRTINHLTPEALRFMKNEIYADYCYKFKDKRWLQIFQNMDAYGYDPATQAPKQPNVSVDDSLTAIDKYNINWINQKLNPGKSKSNILAAK